MAVMGTIANHMVTASKLDQFRELLTGGLRREEVFTAAGVGGCGAREVSHVTRDVSRLRVRGQVPCPAPPSTQPGRQPSVAGHYQDIYSQMETEGLRLMAKSKKII